MRHVVVTGARGFVGERVAAALLSDPRLRDARFTFADLATPRFTDPRVRAVSGDLTDAAFRNDLLDGGVEIIFHLASLLSGASEANAALARRVNVDATLSLLESLSSAKGCPRVVFASSIAVFGTPLPAQVDDHTYPQPSLTYGAHKVMIETVIGQLSRQGRIDGFAPRLPGIVARHDADIRQKSAFWNAIFHAYAQGSDYVLPVSPLARSWLLSVTACVSALVETGLSPFGAFSGNRAFVLPCQLVSISELLEALRRKFPQSGSVIGFEPDPELEAQFGAFPPLKCDTGELLGLVHDGDVDELVERAFDPSPIAEGAAHG